MRKKRLIYNTLSALFNEFIILICDFILPRQVLLTYGSNINGLVTSITQFLGFISLTEMGVGAVVKSALYKPLAEHNEVETSAILKSANVFFRKIGRFLLLYICVLCIGYPFLTKSEFSYSFIVPLILSISISTVAQYYFGIVNQLLLSADQKSYIFLLLNCGSVIINTVASIILMRAGFGIQVVRFVTSIALLVKPIGMTIYVNNHYRIEKQIKLDREPIKQKWNGIAQHIASFILGHTDVIVLTVFSSLSNVSVYNVYYMVVAGVRRILTTAMTGVEALFGDLYARHDSRLERQFAMYEWVMHTGVILLFSVTAILICPFVIVYTRGIDDANYVYPLFGALLVAAYGVYCIRLPYNTMVLAAGHYKETQVSAILEAIINVVLSVVLVNQLGLLGVAIGTLTAMFYRSCYLAYYLSKAILNRSFINYIKHLFIDVLSVLIVVVSTRWFVTEASDYLSWFVMSIKVFVVAFAEVCIINILVYKRELGDLLHYIKRRAKRK